MHRSAVLAIRAVGLLAALAALGSLGPTGCAGYHWVRESRALGPVHRVAVKTFTNQSFEPGIEAMLTESLRRQFQRAGGAVVVDDPAQADLVLGGTVFPLLTTPSAFSSAAFALEYQVQMRVAITARRADGTAIPMPQVAEWELYLTSADVEAEHKNREEALRRLSAVVATRVQDVLSAKLAGAK
jgi:outer membrane lipopolysaccharide assembly protein LptE/RlpB